ncbi:MAG: LysR family transcriptional regulator [Burkholderiales bacterium]|nr:LysR family transcriptional regulator [Burkholderiales bacterium]
MNIGDIDLNLLHVFAAVHETGSVGRAAERLGLSQPATSHALTRLRLRLADPLFVRAPGGVRPTPRAERLAPQVRAALQMLDAALHEAERFDPARSGRRFVLHFSDIGADLFLPPLMAELARRAPALRLQIVQMAPHEVGAALEQGRLDFAVGHLPALQAAPGIEHAALMSERYVVLLRAGHPLADALRDRASLARLAYVVVQSHTEPARALQQLGLEPRVQLALPHFMVVPPVLEATDLALVAPLRAAERFAARHALRIVEPDLGLPPFTVALHWHWRQAQDGGHVWLRGRLQALAAGAPADGAGGRGPFRTAKPAPPRAASAPASARVRTRARTGR